MMLTKNTAQSLGMSDRTDAEQSISGGARYLQDMMTKVPETVPEEERSGLRWRPTIWATRICLMRER
jgi:membrane-bound lytic murein transglycosylase MltF